MEGVQIAQGGSSVDLQVPDAAASPGALPPANRWYKAAGQRVAQEGQPLHACRTAGAQAGSGASPLLTRRELRATAPPAASKATGNTMKTASTCCAYILGARSLSLGRRRPGLAA